MKGTNLGEFEELVLLIVIAIPEEAYSVATGPVHTSIAWQNANAPSKRG